MLLSDTLLAHASAPLRAKLEASAAASELEPTLQALVESARRAWPSLEIPVEAFVRHVAERLPSDGEGDPIAMLASTHAGDLYLACGCALGDERAIAEFDRHFIAQISKYLSRSDALPAVADEVKQTLRANLLVSNGELLPRISGYSGRGPLGAWLRVTATRAALRMRDVERSKGQVGAQDTAVFPAQGDPELDYLRSHYAEDFRGAFQATLAALSPREGSLLRLHFLDGMTIEAIGALYRVSGRTIKRWLARTRRRILDETHRRLAERLRMSTSDLDALIGLLRSRLDVSIVRFLDKD